MFDTLEESLSSGVFSFRQPEPELAFGRIRRFGLDQTARSQVFTQRDGQGSLNPAL